MKPVIYQLVVRYFGNTNQTNRWAGTIEENGCGKFADINVSALRALAEFGITHIWLTGVHRQATLTAYPGLPADDPDVVKGRAGSFYAIRDYYDVCPDYAVDPAARMQEFEDLIARVHDAGMKVLIDLVPNHVARGYGSVVFPDRDFGSGDQQDRFFTRDNHLFYLHEPPGQRLHLRRPAHWQPAGVIFDGEFERESGGPGRIPKASGNNVTRPDPDSNHDWYETVKLNYGYDFVERRGEYQPQPRTWADMDRIVAYWQSKRVDGFRCDFAHYVPAEFWSFLIANARGRAFGAFFMAEAYPWAGSGDPVTDRRQLVDAGFDGIYYDGVYNTLKEIYQGHAGQDQYDNVTNFLSIPRNRLVSYLENHDEIRVAAPVRSNEARGHSGFGSSAAGYQLAPLQALYSNGPFLMLNGQEVGERGGGAEGFHDFSGRTTFFDYWCMPEFAKWVNGHTYDGGQLSQEQRSLRRFYEGLHRLCQDEAVAGDGYWGLKYFNRPERFGDCPADFYSFARYANGRPRLLVVIANFRPNISTAGRIRIPQELVDTLSLPHQLRVRRVLDRRGAIDDLVANLNRIELVQDGFAVDLPTQTSQVYVIEA